jgi:hypothetical protein
VCVSLQGTFDTLPVTEVFGLLASAAKTGALRLEAGGNEASVFLTGGLCCAVESDAALVSGLPAASGSGSATSDTELAARLVDVGFAFARVATGSFRFSDSELSEYDTVVTVPLEPAIAEIRSLVEQWHEIEATIPSLDVRVRLARVLRDDEVVVTAREWGLLVALEGTPTVRELVARCPQPMIEVCRDLKGLVDRGAVEIGVDVVPEMAAAAEPTAAPGVRATPDPAASEALSEMAAGRDHDRSGETVSLLETAEPYAPDTSAPDTSASDTSASNTSAPDTLAPDTLAPDTLAPDTLAPDTSGLDTYAPDSDDFVTAEAAAEAAADADAVAAGIVSRMSRSRLSVPDVFPADEAREGLPADAGAVLTEVPAAGTDRGGPATGPETDDATPDRGALLRLFSALKEN